MDISIHPRKNWKFTLIFYASGWFSLYIYTYKYILYIYSIYIYIYIVHIYIV